MNRREAIKAGVGGVLTFTLPGGCAAPEAGPQQEGVLVNDVHGRISATRVHEIAHPESIDDLAALVRRSRTESRPICIAGRRHSMGGQPFATDGLMADMGRLNRVLSLDADRGLVEVEAGIDWVTLVSWLGERQRDAERPWTIVQKQTGADRLSIGGSLASNIHGRQLAHRPFVEDIEAFTLVDHRGRLLTCSRRENAELFALAVGGYGLFGMVATVTLRLRPRIRVRRIVELMDAADVMPAFERRIADGWLYGDFQYHTDPRGDRGLRRGVFSCYQPVDDAPLTERPLGLGAEDWRRLIHLAHTDAAAAFDAYADHYQRTSGQVDWCDRSQMSLYLDDYHAELDRKLRSPHKGTEVITEIYVPRDELVGFLGDARGAMPATGVPIVYGTVRLIEREETTFLNWAREPFACTIFNLHVEHSPAGLRRARDAFRLLIDLGIRRGGSYYLTYHRWARRDQVLACYPQFPEFLRLKERFDPAGRFQSDWHRHHKRLLA